MTRESRETEANQKDHCDIIKYSKVFVRLFLAVFFFFLYFNHCIPAPFPTDQKKTCLEGFGIWIWMQQVRVHEQTHTLHLQV